MLDIGKYYRGNTGYQNGAIGSLQRLNDYGNQFKAKFQIMRMIKFEPLVMKSTVVGWPKKSPNNMNFYKHKVP